MSTTTLPIDVDPSCPHTVAMPFSFDVEYNPVLVPTK